MKSSKRKPKTRARTRGGLSAVMVAEMIEEATVDAYGECELATGWFTVIGDKLELPFETEVLGVTVAVKRLELRDDNSIVAVCARGADRRRSGSSTYRCLRPSLRRRNGSRRIVAGSAGDEGRLSVPRYWEEEQCNDEITLIGLRGCPLFDHQHRRSRRRPLRPC